MKRLVIFLFLLGLCVLPFSPIAAIQASADVQQVQIDGGDLRGMYLYARNNWDYPSKPELLADNLEAEADTIVSFAKQNGYNAIFYEVRPHGDAMYKSTLFPKSHYLAGQQGGYFSSDPLKTLIKAASTQGIGVFAVVNPFYMGDGSFALSEKNFAVKNPSLCLTVDGKTYLNPQEVQVQNLVVDGIEELAKRYELAGIIVEDIDNPDLESKKYYSVLQGLTTQIYNTIKHLKPDMVLGISFEGELDSAFKQQYLSSVAEDGYVDVVIPRMNAAVNTPNNDYRRNLEELIELFRQTQVELIPSGLAYKLMAPLTDSVIFTNRAEINYQIYTNYALNLSSNIMENYSALRYNAYNLVGDLHSMYSHFTPVNRMEDLNIPQKLAITHPAAPSETTEEAQFFVTGLSNPNEPLYLDGKEVKRSSAYGGFGVLLELEVGKNTFTFSQNSARETISLLHTDPETQPTLSPIGIIQSTDTYPLYDQSVKQTEATLHLQCTAPAGGTVTALVGTENFVLTSEDNLETGVPAIYSADVELNTSTLGLFEIRNLDKVIYTLTYEGIVTNHKSAGKVLLMGSETQLAVKVNKYLGSVLMQPEADGNFLTTLKEGSTDYVSSESATYYELASGGFLHKSEASIIEDNNLRVVNKIENVILQEVEKGEYLNLIGGAGSPYHIEYNPETRSLEIQVFNAVDMPEILAHLRSEMFSKISITNNEDANSAIIYMILKDDVDLWGYNVFYTDDNMIIYCRKKPPISTDPMKPLSGISIVLDAGHGGEDDGALGIGGSYAPAEKNLNLLVALATKSRLEYMGAQVHMTRNDDRTLAMDDRLELAFTTNADLFFSIHHSSLPLTQDGNLVQGMEIYYHEDFSEDFATHLLAHTTRQMNSVDRGVSTSYDRVTRLTSAPSVLFKRGYLSNPAEYGQCCNPFEIYKLAVSLSNSIADYFYTL